MNDSMYTLVSEHACFDLREIAESALVRKWFFLIQVVILGKYGLPVSIQRECSAMYRGLFSYKVFKTIEVEISLPCVKILKLLGKSKVVLLYFLYRLENLVSRCVFIETVLPIEFGEKGGCFLSIADADKWNMVIYCEYHAVESHPYNNMACFIG